jgi:hypothetical protein
MGSQSEYYNSYLVRHFLQTIIANQSQSSNMSIVAEQVKSDDDVGLVTKVIFKCTYNIQENIFKDAAIPNRESF